METWRLQLVKMTTETPFKIKPLGKFNYPEWSGEVKAFLMRQNLWRLVSGKESRPDEAEKAESWDKRAEKAAGDIYLLVESEQRIYFRGFEKDP